MRNLAVFGLFLRGFAASYDKCKEQINKFTEGKLELKPGCTAEQTLESNINGILSKNRDLVGRLLHTPLIFP